jgi:O-acetyl-ADP-ribose deacetylase (regulator of RNase III)
MIEFVKGNLLEAESESLVNTVNTVGVMGKGIALQFRETFPENYKFYQKACKQGQVQIGKMLVFDNGQFVSPRYIINFPTKSHWREKSKLEDVQAGLVDLQKVIPDYGIQSIAVPPLGCGSGGLNWNIVRPLIVNSLSQFEDVKILIYEPIGAPKAEQIRIGTERPNITEGRAALIYLMAHYGILGYRFSLLEIQKLMYFLQAAGQPLRLNYVKKQYGPYAENLNHVLQWVEGHYLRGYGDRSGKASVYLLPDAEAEADQFLNGAPEIQDRLQKVIELIEGFETPYGLELLATVHWLAGEDPNVKENPKAAVEGFEAWNQRKREYFKPEHIFTVWERLRSFGWL